MTTLSGEKSTFTKVQLLTVSSVLGAAELRDNGEEDHAPRAGGNVSEGTFEVILKLECKCVGKYTSLLMNE